MEAIIRFFRGSWYTFKALFGFLDIKTYTIVKVVNPIFQVIFFSLLASYVYNTNDITPWIVGNAFVLCVYNAFFGVGVNLVHERLFGTLKLIVASPNNSFLTFLSKVVFHIFDGLLTISIGLFAGIILFSVELSLSNIGIIMLLAIISMFSACGMGALIGGFGLLIRDINFVLNLCCMVLMALTGVNFPVDKMPIILQNFSYMLPLTRTLKAAREVIVGNYNNLNGLVFGELIIGLVYIVIAYIIMKYIEDIARKRATLDVF